MPAGTARIFLGPYLRRPDVAGAVGGFFLNPMNEADLNLLPLATAGDWLRDPARYQRRASWLRAVAELAGRGRGRRPVRSALRAWAETSWSTKLDLSEAPTFVRLNRAFLKAYASRPDWGRARRALAAELTLAESAGKRLTALADHDFTAEAAPFLDAATQAAGAGRLGTEMLAAERPSLAVHHTRRAFVGSAHPPDSNRAATVRSRYQPQRDASKRNRYFVYGWRTPYAFEIPPYPVPGNVMDAYLDQVDSLDSAWQQHAAAATSAVTLKVGGRPVPLTPSGAFRLSRRSACGKLLVATDGSGGRKAVRLGRCRRRHPR